MPICSIPNNFCQINSNLVSISLRGAADLFPSSIGNLSRATLLLAVNGIASSRINAAGIMYSGTFALKLANSAL